MFSAILIIISMIFLDTNKIRGFQYRPASKVAFYSFVAVFIGLMILGARHVESPYIELGQIFTLVYFLYFLLVTPFISYLENILSTHTLVLHKIDNDKKI
jgi:ubiquinol-cytochrome c reductase cytochrome b subunit